MGKVSSRRPDDRPVRLLTKYVCSDSVGVGYRFVDNCEVGTIRESDPVEQGCFRCWFDLILIIGRRNLKRYLR